MNRRQVLSLIGWMTGALVAFSTTAVGVRAAARTLDVFEILAIRSAFALVVVASVVAWRGEIVTVLRSRRAPLHLLRNVVHFGATYGWALSLTLLPLVTVFALEFTMPIMVAVLAVPLLGERVTATRLAAVALGFAGVIVILRPGAESLQLASLFMLVVAFGFAIVTVMTKKLTVTESTLSILFWMSLVQLPLNLAGSRWGFWSMIPGDLWLPLAGVCAGGLAAHVCLTNAYRLADASVVVPLDFLRIPLIALVGWQIYGETPDPWVLAGAGLIVVGIALNLRAESRR